MVKHNVYLFFFLTPFIFLSCQKRMGHKGQSIPEFDLTQKYSKKTIDINEIADVEYIVPKPNDTTLFTHFTYLTENFIVTHNWIEKSFIFFDREGEPISKVARSGEGPEEYIMTFWLDLYDEKADELYLFTLGNKLMVYDKKGNYKRTLQLPGAADEMFIDVLYNYDEDYLLCHSKSAPDSCAFFLFPKRGGKKRIFIFRLPAKLNQKYQTKPVFQ